MGALCYTVFTLIATFVALTTSPDKISGDWRKTLMILFENVTDMLFKNTFILHF